MPTIRRCCIVGCLSNSRQNPQLQFFQFPRPENPFHKLWKQACHASLSRILPFKKPVVCALHFRPNCIGGRRLTSSAVPSLHLEVPHDLKAVEQQAMIEEIERSRKCAYINAVVYEWLVRANLTPHLRGSITQGMIKEKAETARQYIGSTTFIADNRWLNRFRETHLTGFAQKLASNQLKPVGSSLYIPDIVQDLHHMFPPTSTDRMNFENVPEQYYDYMQQYGEYEEEDDEMKPNLSYQHSNNPYMQQDIKPQLQHPQHMGHQQSPHGYGGGGYEPYGHFLAGGYDDYYYQQQQQHHHQQQQQYQQQHHASYHHTPPPMPSPHTTPIESSNAQQPHLQTPTPTIAPATASTPTPTQQLSRPPSESPHPSQSSSPLQQNETVANTPKSIDVENAAKRPRLENSNEEQNDDESNDRREQQRTDNRSEASQHSSSSDNEAPSENTTSNGNENGNADKDDEPPSPVNSLGHQNGHTIRPIILPKQPAQMKTNTNSNGNGNTTPISNGYATTPSPAATPTPTPTPTPANKTNGADQDNGKRTELQTYAQALEYLKPLEDFVLLKENFRAIGIISHLESVLRKARNRAANTTNEIVGEENKI